MRETFLNHQKKPIMNFLKYISRNGNTSAGVPCRDRELASDFGECAKTHLCRITASKRQGRWLAGPFVHEADPGRSDSASVGTPAQPQPHAMGAARRDPRRGEIPVTRSQARFPFLPRPGEVVSNTGNQKLSSNFRREPPCCIKMDVAGRFLRRIQ